MAAAADYCNKCNSANSLISYIGCNKPSADGRNALSLGGHDTLSVGKSRLTLQGDGNIVLYNSDSAPWASGCVGSGGRYAVMQPDGSCVTHNVVEGDNCDSIASTYGITIDDIVSFNKGKDRTWGFKGCGLDLQRGKICVSTGRPPTPDLQKDAKGNVVQCGYGANYLAFLRELRQVYKASISIAAPASFWYLKGFPIKEISEVVDYIVYMTYDLHGQWDAEREWTKPLLRSHVDWEETMQSLIPTRRY